MAPGRSLALTGFALLFPRAAEAIYEDQVGQLDWRRDHVGVPTSATYATKRLFVATDRGVLAALNARTGRIEWRHLLLDQSGDSKGSVVMRAVGSGIAPGPGQLKPAPGLVTVSGNAGGKVVRMWRAADGALVWDQPTPKAPESSPPGRGPAAFTACVGVSGGLASTGEQVAVVAQGSLSLLAASTGHPAWELSEADLADLAGVPSWAGKGKGVGKGVAWADLWEHSEKGAEDPAGPLGGSVVGLVGWTPAGEVATLLLGSDEDGAAPRVVNKSKAAISPLLGPAAAAGARPPLVAIKPLNGEGAVIAALLADGSVGLAAIGDAKFAKFAPALADSEVGAGPATVVMPSSDGGLSCRFIRAPLEDGGAALFSLTNQAGGGLKLVRAATVGAGGAVGAASSSGEGDRCFLTLADAPTKAAPPKLRVLAVDMATGAAAPVPSSADASLLASGAASAAVSWPQGPLAPALLGGHVVESKQKGGAVSARALGVTHADALAMLQDSKQEPVWVREEALASVRSVVFVSRAHASLAPAKLKDPKLKDLKSSSDSSAVGFPSFAERLDDQRSQIAQGLAAAAQDYLGAAASPLNALLGAALEAGRDLEERVRGVDGLTWAMRRKFGLDRVAVLLTRSGALYGLSLTSGRTLWSTKLPSSYGAGPENEGAKLVATRPHHAGPSPPEVALVGGSSLERLFLDATTGEVTRRLPPLPLTQVLNVAPLPRAKADGKAEGKAEGKSDIEGGFLVTGLSPSGELTACLLSGGEGGASERAVGTYFHGFDRKGALESRVVVAPSDPASASSSCLASEVVGRASVAEEGEEIQLVAYPAKSDVVNSPAQILGDDSLLLKYSNSHLCAVLCSGGGDVRVSLVDTVAGKVLHRVHHASATASPGKGGSAGLVVSENWVVYAYFNSKAMRTEIGVLSLYEGMMGPYDLNPFKVPLQEPSFSSLSAKSPVVMQRTLIAPKAIKSLGATVTAQGISTKNILAVLESGQVAMIPRRMLDPRRPNAPPSKTEMAEGLMQYHPFLFVDPRQLVTMNQTVLGAAHLAATPALIESTTLLLTTGLDLFFTRVTPSKTFDLLAAEFNHGFLLALLGGLFLATVYLRKLDHEKTISSAWQ